MACCVDWDPHAGFVALPPSTTPRTWTHSPGPPGAWMEHPLVVAIGIVLLWVRVQFCWFMASKSNLPTRNGLDWGSSEEPLSDTG